VLRHMFSPLRIKGMTLKNRFAVPPMVTDYGNERGEVTPRLIAYLEARAKGGFGLITVEATTVLPNTSSFPKGLGLWDDHLAKGLSSLAEAVHAHGAKLSVQLYHPGRQTVSALGTQPVSASPLPCPVCGDVPKELSQKDIAVLTKAFGEAAARAKSAGCDAVEIHGAHGYLLNQFISPYSNRRVDEYGGILANRMRFPLEVVKAVRRSCGADFPIIVRLSPNERVVGGLTIEESLVVAGMLAEAGVDILSVSTGVYGSMAYIIPNYCLSEGLNVGDAAAIRQRAGIPVAVAGRITDPLMAESIVKTGKADLVMMGRASIVDPELPNKAAAGALEDIRPCISCNQACVGGINGPAAVMSCLVNPSVGHEKEYVIEEASVKKKVMVVGGGPAGLEAARILAKRGHRVVLYERGERLGGQFRIAAIPPEKQPLAKLIRWQTDQAKKAGVTIKIKEEVTARLIKESQPDVVVIATGGKPLVPDIPGAGAPHVVFAADILEGKATTKNRVIIMGGGSVGCETADLLLHQNKKVTIVEMLDELAQDAESTQRFFLLTRLKTLGADIRTGTRILEVLRDGVRAESGGQPLELVGFDTVVAAFGVAPENALAGKIEGLVSEVHVIGDAKEPRKAVDAIRDAEALARAI
jgi:2,4-dienoyl-CoA reductase-like NADH-dependent reductase (Old Yellow Enzyme family)/pyruvate/2-oxoglutarate dehydrogenase complex dihydrolipoamide dehydrogenase (E3) component